MPRDVAFILMMIIMAVCCTGTVEQQAGTSVQIPVACSTALQAVCGGRCHGHSPPCTSRCATCAGQHQQQLHAAGCDNKAIAAWCSGTGPPSPPRRPAHARNLTMFHINQRNVSSIPINMDLADVDGDLYYYIGMEVVHALECRNTSSSLLAPTDCNISLEGETADFRHLVVTKLIMEVDTRWTNYSDCNKEGGNYRCAGGYGTVSNSSVGIYNLTEFGINHGSHKHQKQCSEPGATYPCLQEIDNWRYNTPAKTGGFWYSTLADGYCGNAQSAHGCSWRVVDIAKRVSRQCFDESFFSVVRSADRSGCFDGCPQPRNTTSSCFIRCFYRTVLGPRSGDGLGPSFIGGMPLSQLEAAWARPFDSTDPARGGCPNLVDDAQRAP